MKLNLKTRLNMSRKNIDLPDIEAFFATNSFNALTMTGTIACTEPTMVSPSLTLNAPVDCRSFKSQCTKTLQPHTLASLIAVCRLASRAVTVSRISYQQSHTTSTSFMIAHDCPPEVHHSPQQRRPSHRKPENHKWRS